MTDDAQRARRRAHNAHALERCNAMGRTAGSILWQPLQRVNDLASGKLRFFMPDGAELSEVPIEWRSERLDTILDEMDAIQAVAPVADPGKAYVETLDVEKWKAEADAVFGPDGAALTPPSLSVRMTGTATDQISLGPIMPAAQHWFEPPAGYVRLEPQPSTISLEELEKAIVDPITASVMPQFRQYRRSQIAELRPYMSGECMSFISVSSEDTKAGSPKPGDMIARNPKNHADQWLVAEQYFKDNFEPIE